MLFSFNYDKGTFTVCFIFSRFPYNNIGTRRALTSVRVRYFQFLIHLINVIAITIHQSAYIPLAHFLFWLYD